jgi:predicted RNase H-like HicB family nuclease
MKALVRIYDCGEPDPAVPEDRRPHRYWGVPPGFPNVVSVGDTREELLANLREALEGCLLVEAGDFEPQPGGEQAEVDL